MHYVSKSYVPLSYTKAPPHEGVRLYHGSERTKLIH